MEYKSKRTSYEAISPGTIGVSQKISSSYRDISDGSKLVYLTKNEIMSCNQNQY